jgi:hypothetical protein
MRRPRSYPCRAARRPVSNRPSPPPRCHTQSPAQAAGPRQGPVPSRRSRQRLRVRRRDLRPAHLTGLPARQPIAGRSWIRPPRGALPGGSAHSSAAVILARRAAASASPARKPLALISANPRRRQPDREAVVRFLLRSGNSSFCGGSQRSCTWRRPDRVIPSRLARIALLNERTDTSPLPQPLTPPTETSGASKEARLAHAAVDSEPGSAEGRSRRTDAGVAPNRGRANVENLRPAGESSTNAGLGACCVENLRRGCRGTMGRARS